jgi:hypothetical protein
MRASIAFVDVQVESDPWQIRFDHESPIAMDGFPAPLLIRLLHSQANVDDKQRAGPARGLRKQDA